MGECVQSSCWRSTFKRLSLQLLALLVMCRQHETLMYVDTFVRVAVGNVTLRLVANLMTFDDTEHYDAVQDVIPDAIKHRRLGDNLLRIIIHLLLSAARQHQGFFRSPGSPVMC